MQYIYRMLETSVEEFSLEEANTGKKFKNARLKEPTAILSSVQAYACKYTDHLTGTFYEVKWCILP
jgi:hypothetical protein